MCSVAQCPPGPPSPQTLPAASRCIVHPMHHIQHHTVSTQWQCKHSHSHSHSHAYIRQHAKDDPIVVAFGLSLQCLQHGWQGANGGLWQLHRIARHCVLLVITLGTDRAGFTQGSVTLRSCLLSQPPVSQGTSAVTALQHLNYLEGRLVGAAHRGCDPILPHSQRRAGRKVPGASQSEAV